MYHTKGYESFTSPRSSLSLSPTPTFTRIRFNDNPQYIEPPSPPMSISSPTLYSSGDYTQPSSRGSPQSNLNSSINPLLRHQSSTCIKVGFYSSSRDLRYRANNSNDSLAQSALGPGIQIDTIAIMANGLPWTTTISALSLGHIVTVGDVLTELLKSLEVPVTHSEFHRDSSARRVDVQRNFASRCAFVSKRTNSRLDENDDWNRGVIRRGDYLGGWSFRGLTVRGVEGATMSMKLHWVAASSD
ncbi:hypothetical protein E1B28_003322 [Marasmius oreades]|uniref:DUF6699 domain-containing protein n=1 Tax=Marasmius oreades TaxID=181124 RepID=A0A9P7RL57_9AGAR|nr:uncharacterized protein E1B28_003322 [Marasmius oreades]KAG7085781.1 hypothetical protein E1B28_003322 [Marasmius oreades]